MLNSRVENDKLVLDNVGVFVIPNPAGKVSSIILPKVMMLEEIRNDTCPSNGVELHDDDRMVQLWWFQTKGDVFDSNLDDDDATICDNIAAHHPTVFYRDKKWEFKMAGGVELPTSIVGTWREKDETVFNTVAYLTRYSDDMEERERCKVAVEVHVTPAQSITRYRRYGTFEDAVKAAIA